MRIIGLDIHRAFAEAVALDDGVCRRLGRIGMTRDQLKAFAEDLRPTDHVVVESTGNATAVLDILAAKVARVAVANPLQVHLIARAKTKTDKIDARVLAKLYAAGFLPEVWIPDLATQARRRQVTRRNRLVQSRARLKAIAQSMPHTRISPRAARMPTCSAERGVPGSGHRSCRRTNVSRSSATSRNTTARPRRKSPPSATSLASRSRTRT
jgi:transposase